MSARSTLIIPVEADGTHFVKAANGKVTPFLAGSLSGQIIDVVLPGQMVRIYAHELPKMREREKQAAAKFAIEDRTGTSLEGQHIVLGGGADNRIAIIGKAALRDIISSLEGQNLQIGDIYADFDWLAAQDEPALLPDRIVFAGPEGYTIDPEWAEDNLADIAPLDWDDAALSGSALSLRQGEFSRRGGLNLHFASLSKIAALFVLTGMSWLALQWAQTGAVKKQAQDLKSQTAALYTQATGQAAPDNPALAVTRAVKGGQKNGSDFIALLAGLNAALEQTNNIAVQNLSFEQDKGQLNLRLIYPSFESASELEAAVTRMGGMFRAGGVREQNGVLIGEASFEIGGPS